MSGHVAAVPQEFAGRAVPANITSLCLLAFIHPLSIFHQVTDDHRAESTPHLDWRLTHLKRDVLSVSMDSTRGCSPSLDDTFKREYGLES